MNDVKKAAQEQAEEAYVGFIKFSKYIAYGSLLFLLIVARCNFGDDGRECWWYFQGLPYHKRRI